MNVKTIPTTLLAIALGLVTAAQAENLTKVEFSLSEFIPAPSSAKSTVTVSTSASPAGAGTITGGGAYTTGTTVTITANPDSCFQFSKWTEGAKTITNNPYTFTISNNVSLVAHFTQLQYTITAFADTPTAGTITGAGKKECGAKATLTATAKPGFKFLQWIDLANSQVLGTKATLAFDVDSDRDLQAVFVDSQPPTLTISSPTANEKVSISVFTISGKITDNVSPAYVAYSLNGAAWVEIAAANPWSTIVSLIPGSQNTLWIYAADTSGNFTKTNKINFKCTALGYAPPSISGLIGTVNLTSDPAFELSFGADTFAETDYNANHDAIGLYSYVPTSSNTAQLILNYTLPSSNAGSSGPISLSFSDAYTAAISDTNGDSGAIHFSPAPNSAPSSLSGAVTVSSSAIQNGYSNTNIFGDNFFISEDSTGSTFSGEYTFVQCSPNTAVVSETITNPAIGTSNLMILTYGNTPGSSHYYYTGFENSGQPMTDHGAFVQSPQTISPGYAPAALAGSELQFKPKNLDAYSVSFDSATLGISALLVFDTGVATYTYNLLGANTAEIDWSYLPPYNLFRGYGPSSALLTFTKKGAASYTNLTTGETGTLTVIPSPATVPVSLIGKTATITYISDKKVKNAKVMFGYGTFAATNTTSSPTSAGNWTCMPITPNTAFANLTYTDAADAGLAESLQLTFTTSGAGLFVGALTTSSNTIGYQGPFTLVTTPP